MIEPLRVGSREIGGGVPCFVIAEVGVNHNGDVELAHQLIEASKAAGADAVKFQTFDPGTLASETAAAAPYQTRTTGKTNQRKMLEDLTLPTGAWSELRDHAVALHLQFLSTPFDIRSAQLLAEIGAPALKVPSGEVTNTPFIRELAGLGLPILVSTGMANLDEVATAVTACARAPGVALFHCVSAYPAPESEANLRGMETLRSTFGVPTGWSDHTVGPFTAVLAVAAGASMLEKHITLDRTMRGPDHAASEDLEGFADYMAAVRRTEKILGDGIKRPQPSELANRGAARRSWHAARDLNVGDIVTPSSVVALRPAEGLDPSYPIVGRRLRRRVEAGTAVTGDDLEMPRGRWR